MVTGGFKRLTVHIYIYTTTSATITMVYICRIESVLTFARHPPSFAAVCAFEGMLQVGAWPLVLDKMALYVSPFSPIFTHPCNRRRIRNTALPPPSLPPPSPVQPCHCHL